MIKIRELQAMLEEKKYRECFAHFTGWIDNTRKEKSLYRTAVSLIGRLQTEEEYRIAMKIAHEGCMFRYESFMERFAYHRLRTPQSRIWYAETLGGEGRWTKAESHLVSVLGEENLEDTIKRSAHLVLARVMMEMRRFKSASLHLAHAESLGERRMLYHRGILYFYTGKWRKAEELFHEGMEKEKDDFAYHLMLCRLYGNRGEEGKAEATLEEALMLYPEHPWLLRERIKFAEVKGDMGAFAEYSQRMNEVTPHHEYQGYFAAVLHREQSEVACTAENTKDGADKTRNEIMLQPVVQKYNYCVPTCVEMIAKRWNVHVHQDEVAAHIFDGDGTKIYKAVEYMKRLGLTGRYFVGTVERYRRLVDMDIPVMVSISYPDSSHVQIIRGYDDERKSLLIQDPGMLQVQYVSYEGFAKRYAYEHYLSLAVIPQGEEVDFSFLPEDEHEAFITVDRFAKALEECRPDEEIEKLKQSITRGLHQPYNLIQVVRQAGFFADKELIDGAVKDLLERYSNEEYFLLISAQAFIQVNEYEKAEAMLDSITSPRYRDSYWFAKGRVHYYKEEYEKAEFCLHQALSYDATNYAMWSFLAMTSFYRNDLEDALRYSHASLEINSITPFTLLNHGALLMEKEEYGRALALYTKLTRLSPGYGRVWYEKGKCHKERGEHELALSCFAEAQRQDPDVPLSYREQARIYEYEHQDIERALEILEEGLRQLPGHTMLLMVKGDILYRAERYEEAEAAFNSCIQNEPDEDSYAYIMMARILYALEREKEIPPILQQGETYFAEEAYFLCHAGQLLWDMEPEREWAVGLLTRGVLAAPPANREAAVEMMVRCLQGTAYYHQGIDVLEELLKRAGEDTDLLCYIGCLYEDNGDIEEAVKCFCKAREWDDTDTNTFPVYRLGEVALHTGDKEEAASYYRTCLKMDPDFTVAYERLAMIAGEQGDKEEERKRWLEVFCRLPKRFENLDEEFTHLLSLVEEKTDLQNIIQQLEEWQDEVPEAWRLQALAIVYEKAGEAEQAEMCYHAVLKDVPQDEEVQKRWVSFLLAQQKSKEAEDCLLEYLVKQPQSRLLAGALADLLYQTKRGSHASRMVEELPVSKEEKSILMLHYAERIERRQLDEHEVFANRKAAGFMGKLLNGCRKFLHESRGYIRISMLYEEAIEYNRENMKAYLWYSDFLEKSEMRDDAIVWLRKGLEVRWDALCAAQLASTLYEKYWEHEEGKAEKFRIYLEEAGELSERLLTELSDDPHFLKMAGFIFMNLEWLEHSEEAFRCCLALSRQAEAYYGLANVYRLKGEAEQAIEMYNECLKLEPSHEQAVEEKEWLEGVMTQADLEYISQ
ncbi:tetratricopeptide repeat protein [Aneurinibacillus aneurinilyticus]|uniref:Tetratricopeptide repeat protein n=1 Tax=Aneurinibacillus aneurinilyticus TaxID=1391 RepID=A0A848D217_ANEAE|nr:tetratricopeptide repeat protein [Aneurinibacillus aneurinilyticus]NMF01302.1 tetratricopeptide repeat protein [Aneurinibacillus aneurinilyticus]